MRVHTRRNKKERLWGGAGRGSCQQIVYFINFKLSVVKKKKKQQKTENKKQTHTKYWEKLLGECEWRTLVSILRVGGVVPHALREIVDYETKYSSWKLIKSYTKKLF